MQIMKKMTPYLFVILLDFYILPLFIRNTGLAIVLLLVIIPLVCFICSVFYGIKNAFHVSYAVAVAILFIPAIFIYYNISAWLYIFAYGINALAGDFIGSLFYQRKTADKHGENHMK